MGEHAELDVTTEVVETCPMTTVGTLKGCSYQNSCPDFSRINVDSRYCRYILQEGRVSFLGVFKGYNEDFASERSAFWMCSNILLSQAELRSVIGTDEEESYVKKILRNAFAEVEQSFYNYLNYKHSNLRKSDNIVDKDLSISRINEFNRALSSGAFVTIVLIIDDRLYIANTGKTYVCLCDERRIKILNESHDIQNIKERERLEHLNANVKYLMEKGHKNGMKHTRALGDLAIKMEYNLLKPFKDCVRMPIIYEPYVSDKIMLSAHSRMLMITCAELYDLVCDLGFTKDTIFDEIQRRLISFLSKGGSDLAAQLTIESIVEDHYKRYLETSSAKQCYGDLILVVKLFNHSDWNLDSCTITLLNNAEIHIDEAMEALYEVQKIRKNQCDDTLCSQTEILPPYKQSSAIVPYVDFNDIQNLEETNLDFSNKVKFLMVLLSKEYGKTLSELIDLIKL